MPIIQTQCTIFKYNMLCGLEDFLTPSPYVYKIALYNGNANLNASTTAYTTNNEITGTGYTAGGKVLTPIAPSYDSSANTAYVSFNNITWSPAEFTTSGALIYNSSTNAAVAVLNFGNPKTTTNEFTITFPVATATSAIIRIS